jgi:hypothetical protein
MSTIADLFLATDSYGSVAERYITETRDLRTPGRTIAQSRQVFSILQALSLRSGTCGGDGYFMVYEDNSAIVTNSAADRIYPHWNS